MGHFIENSSVAKVVANIFSSASGLKAYTHQLSSFISKYKKMKRLERSQMKNVKGGLFDGGTNGFCGKLTYMGCDNCGTNLMTCDYKWEEPGGTWSLCRQSCVTGVTTAGSSKIICTAS